MIYSMEELVPIVAKLAEKYTGGESSSISYEKAQMLMEAVLYCIHACENGEENMLQKENVTVKEAYAAGSRIVMERVLRLRELYHEMLPAFCDYGMVCLHEVVIKGMPEFLKRYDVRFCPQETLLTLDYPVLCRIAPLTGIDAVLKYAKCIALEQEFLAGFEESYIRELLRRYHSDYEDLVENICSIVLPNVIGHLLLQKPLSQSGFSEEELERLEKGLREQEKAEALLEKAISRIAAQYAEDAQKLEAYLCLEIPNMAVRIAQAGEDRCLHRIFFL